MLPVPIEFTLPNGWRSVPPARAGAPDVEFLAVHPGSSAGFTATIAVTGRVREDGAGLDELADESTRRLAEQAVAVKIGRRERAGDETSGSLTQALGLRVRTGGELTDLAQLRTFLTVAGRTGSGRLLVVDVVLTATPAQLAQLIADFHAFVGGIRPDLSSPRRRPAPSRPPWPRLPPHSPPGRPGRHRREP